jgi:hypothetical protein
VSWALRWNVGEATPVDPKHDWQLNSTAHCDCGDLKHYQMHQEMHHHAAHQSGCLSRRKNSIKKLTVAAAGTKLTVAAGTKAGVGTKESRSRP